MKTIGFVLSLLGGFGCASTRDFSSIPRAYESLILYCKVEEDPVSKSHVYKVLRVLRGKYSKSILSVLPIEEEKLGEELLVCFGKDYNGFPIQHYKTVNDGKLLFLTESGLKRLSISDYEEFLKNTENKEYPSSPESY